MEALDAAKNKLHEYNNVIYVHDVHENIAQILNNIGISKVDGILLDLGVSSYQLDEPIRGFSYMLDGVLDMRMDETNGIMAKDIVNSYSEEELTQIFFKYGEEKYSKRIAKNIVTCRKEKEIETTLELVKIIKEAMPTSALKEKQHPAKRVFQALRIETNKELIGLRKAIIDAVKCLKQGGVIAIITFHSLEDRIVKNTFEELEGKCTCPKSFPVCVCNKKCYGSIVNKKPYTATPEELDENPRARSAKLRVFKRNEV